MRSSRLLTLQMLLQTRGRMTARELSAHLEVSERTLYRDVDQLTAAGVPIYAERGRAGGFQLMEGWKTTLTGFTSSEAQAVFLSGLAGPAAQLGLGQQVSDAQLKLLAALPAPQREDAHRLLSRFHLDPLGWYRDAAPVPHLPTVTAAVWEGKQLLLQYESWRSNAKRVVNPLGLVLKAGDWYLVAAADGKPRTYRISNVQSAALRQEKAARPAKFDLGAYWTESTRRFEAELYRAHAVVLAAPAGVKALRRLSTAVARAVDEQAPKTVAAEPLRLRVPVESLEDATTQLLQLAPAVEVIEPPALRRAIIARVREIARRYA